MKSLSIFFLLLVPQIILSQTNPPKTLTFDYQLVKSKIKQIPSDSRGNLFSEKTVIKLIVPTGEQKDFEVEENSNFSPELALTFPEIKTFVGTCTTDKMLTVRFDVSPLGYSAIYNDHGGIVIIEPKDLSKNLYNVTPYEETQHNWYCGIDEQKTNKSSRSKRKAAPDAITNGAILKTIKVAFATTGEFTTLNGGVAQSIARINSFLSIINGIYIPEFAIKFELVNNTAIVFTDAATDPFTPSPTNISASQSGTAFYNFNGNNTLLYAAYDVGHTLHAINNTNTGSISASGVASVGCVCLDSFKGTGWSQYTANNTNNNINAIMGSILTHELGHQMGATHSFNGQGSNCTNQLRDQYEPGSGTTIMSYFGLCSSTQNLTGTKDNQFHISSMESILFNLADYPTCGTNVNLPNILPVVNAGADYTVPANTPFLLRGTATDGNNDPLSYTWEQKDAGVYNDAGALGQTNGVGGYSAVRSRTAPLFRTKKSTTTTNRSFPAEAFVLNNQNNPVDNEGEDLSIANRTITMSLTARDNKVTGGGTVSDEVIITVDSLKGPFLVTSPNVAAISWGAGSSQTITWSVNNTNLLSPNIDILISTNGGTTFTMLAVNTPNDGSETIILPTTLTTQGRIKIVSKNSSTAEFYDISNVNFSIVVACPANNVVFQSNKTGLWSDLSVWNCGSILSTRLPNITDTVKINATHTVTLDVNASIKLLNLLGRLSFQTGKGLSY